jgi:hypothetical protein
VPSLCQIWCLAMPVCCHASCSCNAASNRIHDIIAEGRDHSSKRVRYISVYIVVDLCNTQVQGHSGRELISYATIEF